jgi:hypothetical protein
VRSESPFETGKVPFTKDLLKKLMHCGSVAVGFERSSFMNFLELFTDEFDLDRWQFVNFVRSTAAHIDKDDGFMGIVRQWKRRVGTIGVHGLATTTFLTSQKRK